MGLKVVSAFPATTARPRVVPSFFFCWLGPKQVSIFLAATAGPYSGFTGTEAAARPLKVNCIVCTYADNTSQLGGTPNPPAPANLGDYPNLLKNCLG